MHPRLRLWFKKVKNACPTAGHAYNLLDSSLFIVKYLQMNKIWSLLVTKSSPDPTPVSGQEQSPALASSRRI